MSRLVETLKIDNGIIMNVPFHNERMSRSLFGVFGLKKECDLERIIDIPEFAHKGVYKCRVEYDEKNTRVEFLLYKLKHVRSLKIILDNDICYPYKYTDRDNINRLVKMRGTCDDILIVKNGMVTDTSYSNVVFRDLNGNWVTPATYLLPGTRRASLLQKGKICERDISAADIPKYTELKLINAMLDLDDSAGIPVDFVE